MKFNLLYCLVFLATSLPAQDIYSWIDKNGIVKFSDNIPAHIKSEDITKISTRQDKSFKSVDQLAIDEGKTVSQQQHELEQMAKNNCEVATQNLQVLTSFKNITQLDDIGNKVRLSDEEKVQEISLVQKQIEIFCT